MADSKSSKPILDKALLDNEEDLDDLDDVLDQFSSGGHKPPSTLPAAPPPTATASNFLSPSSGRPRTNTRVDAQPPSVPGLGPPLDPTAEVDEGELSSEFARELARGMESLMQDIAGSAAAGGSAGSGEDDEVTDEERTKAFKAAWEAMLVEGMNGQGGDDLLPSLGDILGDAGTAKKGAAPAPSSSSTTTAGGNFQEKIKQAMDKLKESDAGASSAQGNSSNPESIEALLKSLGDLGLDEGAENDAELAGLLETMMGQLMSKEILYEPLKELADGFPPYLANPPQPLTDSDKERYEKQLACVRRIVVLFEEPSYSDSSPESNKVVVELMSEMQSYGSPPAEIMGPLPAGLDGTGIPGFNPNDPEGCTIT